MASREPIGIDIIYSDPIWKNSRSTFLDRLSSKISSYRHEIRTIGNFYSATISFNDTQSNIEGWIENGLGRHIDVYNTALKKVFEGYVNKISISLGTLNQFDIGPLSDIGNQVYASYNVFDNSVSPPLSGTNQLTDVATDAASQTKYGVIEKIITIGNVGQAIAEQARDIYLSEKAYPPISAQGRLVGTADPSVTIEILGYWHILKNYIYNNLSTSTVNLSDKIIDILSSEPTAGIFSADTSKITENTTQVAENEDQNRTALDIIKQLNQIGDSSNNRYKIGFIEDRQLVYEQIPDDWEYQQRISANDGIFYRNNTIARPYNIQAGKWIFFSDFLVGRSFQAAGSLNKDPRFSFIESVTYTTPYDVTFSGQKISALDQFLARSGLTGIA